MVRKVNRRAKMLEVSNHILTPEEQTDLLYGSVLGKARRRGLEATVSRQAIYAMVVARDTCPLSGIPFDNRHGVHLPFRRSLDRIDNSAGYVPDNLQVIANIVNKIKSVYPMDTLLYTVREMASYQAAREAHLQHRTEPMLPIDWRGYDVENGVG